MMRFDRYAMRLAWLIAVLLFRPFMFRIVSLPDKLPIFGGRVVDPTAGEEDNQEKGEELEGEDSEAEQD